MATRRINSEQVRARVKRRSLESQGRLQRFSETWPICGHVTRALLPFLACHNRVVIHQISGAPAQTEQLQPSGCETSKAKQHATRWRSIRVKSSSIPVAISCLRSLSIPTSPLPRFLPRVKKHVCGILCMQSLNNSECSRSLFPFPIFTCRTLLGSCRWTRTRSRTAFLRAQQTAITCRRHHIAKVRRDAGQGQGQNLVRQGRKLRDPRRKHFGSPSRKENPSGVYTTRRSAGARAQPQHQT